MSDLKLWRIWQTETDGYDTFDSAVVAPDATYVSAMEIGTANGVFVAGAVIVASFNAG
jgi:hypothetical protein